MRNEQTERQRGSKNSSTQGWGQPNSVTALEVSARGNHEISRFHENGNYVRDGTLRVSSPSSGYGWEIWQSQLAPVWIAIPGTFPQRPFCMTRRQHLRRDRGVYVRNVRRCTLAAGNASSRLHESVRSRIPKSPHRYFPGWRSNRDISCGPVAPALPLSPVRRREW